jgi:Tol biopolymer transport system component
MKTAKTSLFGLLSLLFILILANLAYSQGYFGRNKVQYKDFNFNILKTRNFDIYFYPVEKNQTFNAAEMLERWRKRYENIFGDVLEKNQPVVLYSDHADFEQTNVIEGFLSQGTGGVTEGLKNRITIPFTGVNADNNHVLGHELVHAFQYDLIRKVKNGFKSASGIPLWFIEGMAEYLSIGRKDELTSMWLRDAVLNKDVPSIDDVGREPKYFPYRYGQAIWAYIGSRWGDKSVADLLRTSINSGWDGAFKKVIGIPLDTLSVQWKEAVTKTYNRELEGKTVPDSVGQKVSVEEGGINLSPVVSPDGKYVAVIARHNLLTLDLYLIDAHTGKVYKKLVSSNSDAHFDALQFINSSGSWSPDGKKFAFVVVENGDNAISVVDVNSGNIEKTFKLKNVEGILQLDWSPDGKKLAVAGTHGGTSNIYLYQLDNGELTDFTNDNYSEIQPAWSTDGKTLAYVTDRGGDTRLDKYIFGTMKIAMFSLPNKTTHYLSLGKGIKLINPQFSPDGHSIYFISNPDGISNIFRYSFDNDKFYRVTNVATGISGLTALSSAMSVAKKSGRLVFNVFNHADYDIYGLSPDSAKGSVFRKNAGEFAWNISLPEIKNSNKGIVEDYLSDDLHGLPENPDTSFKQTEYSASLHLFSVGQTSVGVGFDRFGTYLGGAVSMLFSDMLGNHILSGVIQANGTFKDIGGQLLYYNRKNRFNWGVSVGHIPYLSASFGSAIDTVSLQGKKYLARDFIYYKQRVFDNQVNLLGSYPLSENRRIEFGVGYRRISYNVEAEHTQVVGNIIVNNYTEGLPSPDALNLFQSDLAYVGDYSLSGFTSPIDGSRFRFGVQPSIGSINFVSLTADIRKYFFFKPFTLAFRLLHYGRYGNGAESNRLSPLYLGYPTWVRGYDLNSINQSECNGASNPAGCPVFERLVGSRIGVFNMEFRIPLFGTEQFGLVNFPFLPTEISFFLDGGVAWSGGQGARLAFETNTPDRVPVFSTGVAARVNLFGYLIGQVYYAHAFQRPGNSQQIGFVISPGW